MLGCSLTWAIKITCIFDWLPFQGGISSGFQKSVEDKDLTDEIYTADGVALIQISGTSVHNNKSVQVDGVCVH